MGGSTSRGGTSNNWAINHGPAASNGYIRSRGGADEFALTKGTGKSGITTVIESDTDLERHGHMSGRSSDGDIDQSQTNGRWGHRDGKLSRDGDDGRDRSWSQQRILKTTESTQVVYGV
jgi:hypothetical protein